MNDTVMTIVGNLVDEPRLRVTKNGHSVANFRVASTSRRFDRETNAWTDNATLLDTRIRTYTDDEAAAARCPLAPSEGHQSDVKQAFLLDRR